jgi:serine/threonine protein kinase
MTGDTSTFPPEPDDQEAFGDYFENYEKVLHDDPGLTPEQWLLDQYPQALREQLADLHLLYRASRPAPARPPAPASPGSIPGYEILGELGRGGMGVVYQARQVLLNRVVALKVLLAGAHAGGEALARFRAEAEAAARLQHPHIVQIHEVGEHDGRPYLVLEYIDGGSLKHQLDGTPQPARPAARLVELLARAVHHAHQQGVIHRDLKPANILLQEEISRKGAKDAKDESDGQPLVAKPPATPLRGCASAALVPKITDFGLAKKLDIDEGQTRTGAILGTPSYMAPEQAEGRTREVGPAVDMYALGAILYELLTGRPPFKAQTPLETLLQVQHDEPVPPRRLQPRVPRDLETICLKCLHKNPHKRYATAEDLAQDLRRFGEGQPIQARPTPVWERAVKWARRRPTAAALVGVITLAALALLVVGVWSNRALVEAAQREHRKAEEANSQRAAAEKERKHAAAQQALAAAHLQNALDLLEPLSLLISGDYLAKTQEGQDFRREFSGSGRRYYQKLLADKDNPDPQMQRQIGRVFHGLGMSHAVLSEGKEAEQAFLQAIALQERLVKQFPAEVDARVDLSVTCYSLGDLYAAQGAREKAGASYAKIIPLVQSLPPNNQRVALFANNLSHKLCVMGKFQEALRWMNLLIGRTQTLLRQETQPDRRHNAAFALAIAYYARALILLELGQHAQAVQDFKRARNVKGAKLPPAIARNCLILGFSSWLKSGKSAKPPAK